MRVAILVLVITSCKQAVYIHTPTKTRCAKIATHFVTGRDYLTSCDKYDSIINPTDVVVIYE